MNKDYDPIKFGATQVTEASSYDPTQFGATPITLGMEGAKAPDNESGFFQPLKDTLHKFINNDEESLQDFGTRKAQQAIVGIPFPSTVSDFEDKGNRTDNLLTDLGNIGKIGANGIADLANLPADVANFAWQSFRHPIDTAKTIVQDPVGFAEGMVGDLITQPLEGAATAIKDLSTGQGGGKALEDARNGLQKGVMAFIDRPITSLIQLKLAKGLATDPVGTIKTVGKDTVDLSTKPWQLAYKFAKSPKQAISDVAEAVQSKYDAIKSIPSFFTKEGQAKIAQGVGNQIMEYTQNSMKITDLQERLKSLDINSDAYSKTLDEMNMAKSKVEKAKSDVSSLISSFADKTRDIFSKIGYSNTGEFINDTAHTVEGLYKSKDLNGALNPDGKTVTVTDIKPITDYLREQGKNLEAKDNPDGKLFQNMANDLDLRHQITQAGGEKGYIEKQVSERLASEGIDPTKKPAAYDMAKAQYTDQAVNELAKNIASKPSFFTRPLTTADLYDYMTGKHGEATTGFGQKLLSNPNESNPTSHSLTIDAINKDLANVDPTAPEKLASESKKASELRDTWSRWKDKTFSNIGDMVNFITKDNNWSEFQKFPQEIKAKFQNTLVSHIIDLSKKSDGSIDFNKLSKLNQKFSENLTSNQSGKLSELSYANGLPEDVHSTPSINEDVRNVMTAKGELSSSESQVSETESKAAQLKANMDVVGTTPEKIATNLKSIQTMDDLTDFMKAANIKDPRVLGDLITGTLYDQMQQQFGEAKGVNFKSLTDLVKQVREIGKNSPLGEQLKKSLFSPERQKALEVLEEQSQKLTNMFEDKGFTPGVKRLFHAALGAGAAVLGWHVTAARNFFDAVKPGAGTDGEIVPNESNLKKMSPKASSKKGIVQKTVESIPKITPASEGLKNNEDSIPEWFKNEAANRGYEGDLNDAWKTFNDHVNE